MPIEFMPPRLPELAFGRTRTVKPQAGNAPVFSGSGPELMSGVPRGYIQPALRFGSQPAVARAEAFEAAFRQKTGFSLDPFQKESLRILYEGKSPIVAAATSSGKTLVAEAAIQDALANGKRLFYTAPRKAISNFMFNEFCDKYGRENIGIQTGDVTVNPEAPIILMTTEIFRNMLYKPDGSQDRFKDLNYVVFDECHFINDEERGSVWEESALYARKELPNVQQIHLSATVGNPEEYRDWLNSLNTTGTKAGEFELVTNNQRPVPLTAQYLSRDNGTLVNILDREGEPTREFEMAFSRNKRNPRASEFDPVFTVKTLQRNNQLPLIEFVFGRKACNENAKRVLNSDLGLTNDEEKRRINQIIDAYIETYPSLEQSELLPYLVEGVGYHHADMWPREKELVETLLKAKLLKAVFATTTLAEGVNVPAQSVGISSLEIRKKDGMQPVSESEFQQMTGRAGRRGMFEHGYAVLAHPKDNEMKSILTLVRSRPNDLKSQFKVNPYMTLNLIDRLRDPEKIRVLLEEGFRAFQLRREMPESLKGKKKFKVQGRRAKATERSAEQAHQTKAGALSLEFKAMREYLAATGFINKDNSLTELGKLAGQIPVESNLLVAKAIQAGILNSLEPADLAAVLSTTVDDMPSYMQKYGDGIAGSSQNIELDGKLIELNDLKRALDADAFRMGVETGADLGAANVDIIAKWCRTHDRELLEDSPGKLSYSILRTANLLQHIEKSSMADAALKAKATEARSQLLAGIIMEQIKPKKVEIEE